MRPKLGKAETQGRKNYENIGGTEGKSVHEVL